ncbi:MAG: hypothetical protein ACK55I_05735, partial [bacterium]
MMFHCVSGGRSKNDLYSISASLPRRAPGRQPLVVDAHVRVLTKLTAKQFGYVGRHAAQRVVVCRKPRVVPESDDETGFLAAAVDESRRRHGDAARRLLAPAADDLLRV